MKVLVLGANGQVGRELVSLLRSEVECVAATRDGRLFDGSACAQADLAQPTSLHKLIVEQAPDWLINAAAYTAVDRAESEFELAMQINAHALNTMADACTKTRTSILHYSTDYVFSGNSSIPYVEQDAPAPINRYGASKLAGEHVLTQSNCQHIIIRVAWVYAAHGKNFLNTMLRLGNERQQIQVVSDQIGVPTPAHWLADASVQLITKPNICSGLWHLAPQGRTSWYDFAREIYIRAKQLGLIKHIPEVNAIDSSQYRVAAQRPAYSVLNANAIRNQFHIGLAPWQVGLDQVLEQILKSTNSNYQ